jgi:hypothetical protein
MGDDHNHAADANDGLDDVDTMKTTTTTMMMIVIILPFDAVCINDLSIPPH